jgi:hypothetical protein
MREMSNVDKMVHRIPLRDTPQVSVPCVCSQWNLLNLLASEAARYPTLSPKMCSTPDNLIYADGAMVGVRYHDDAGERELLAAHIVAADGRDSILRRLARLLVKEYRSAIDVMWFQLSRRDTDPDAVVGRISRGRAVALLDRQAYWQVAYPVPSGGYAAIRARGIDALRTDVAELMPTPANCADEIACWDDVKALQVRVNRLRKWYMPGLLGGSRLNYVLPFAFFVVLIFSPSSAWHRTSEPYCASTGCTPRRKSAYSACLRAAPWGRRRSLSAYQLLALPSCMLSCISVSSYVNFVNAEAVLC